METVNLLTAYNFGSALATFHKTAGQPVRAYGLTGRLYLSSSNWLLLAVPNAVVRGAFDALQEPGIELPLKDGKLNAHISVMSKEEVEKIGPENISERGHSFGYQIGQVEEVVPDNWEGVSKVWYLRVKSPELRNLRKSYGLSPLMHDDHNFHITIAIRRTNVLRENDVSKAAEEDYFAEPDWSVFDKSAVDKLAAEFSC